MADGTAREGETRDRVFTVGGASAVDLTTATLVVLRRKDNNGNEDSTDNDTGLLTVTGAAAGEVTLEPDADFWADGVKYYDMYIDVTIAGVVTSYPSATNLRMEIVEAFD